MKKFVLLVAAATLALPAATASAQVSTSSRDRIGALLGAIFGDRLGATTSIDAQWAAGQTPLNDQRYQFETRVDAEVRAGNLTQSAAQRLKSDYYALAQTEASYGADGRFTAQERADLTARYNALNQVLASGGYADSGYQNGNYPGGSSTADVAAGRAEFEARVNAAVAARRLTRTQATRLKTDYADAVRIEASYLRDGVIDSREQQDLDARLDALDSRIGDTPYGTAALTARARLDAVARALPYSGLTATAQAMLRVQAEDLIRLDAAYARINETAEERAYIDRRLVELEAQARVRR
ncbi:MAG: hypothetical protein ABIP41_07815 [Croceibacterium sp.]